MTDLTTLSVKELVRYHNAIAGVKAINIWKESKAKLLERTMHDDGVQARIDELDRVEQVVPSARDPQPSAAIPELLR